MNKLKNRKTFMRYLKKRVSLTQNTLDNAKMPKPAIAISMA